MRHLRTPSKRPRRSAGRPTVSVQARLATLALGVALTAGGCGGATLGAPTVTAAPARGSAVVQGAGTAGTYPLYEEIGAQLAQRGITLDYRLTGEDAALASFSHGAVQLVERQAFEPFWDPPRDGDTTALPVPIGVSAVAITYDLPSLRRPLRLSAATLADIYLGKVRRWNAPPIARLNPGVHLPALPILLVHLSGPAGATAMLTAYLSTVHAWRRQVGAGATVRWPGGTGTPDDGETAQVVARSRGAIGYLAGTTAQRDGLPTARLQNLRGTFVAPTPAATGLAAAGGGLDPRSVASTRAPRGAYPLAFVEYLLVYRDLCAAGANTAQAQATQRVLEYALGQGQVDVSRAGLAPLPSMLLSRARKAVQGLMCNSQAIS